MSIRNLPASYEISGIGSAPDEDDFVIMPEKEIKQLREKPGFFSSLFSGPYELSGIGSDSAESDFVIQEIVERGIRK